MTTRLAMKTGLIMFAGTFLFGCAGVGTQTGGNLTRVFVPPPPLGAGSSTITVVPSRKGASKATEKSWGQSDAPGGSAAAAPPSSVTTASGPPRGGIGSIYDLNATTPRDAKTGASASKPTKNTAPAPEKPVPVLYNKTGGAAVSPTDSENSSDSADFDPRLSS